MTLHELYLATGKELSMVASDTTGQQVLVLNHRTAPDCPVVWAVRMSMSIPLVWQEVEWRTEWGKYRDSDIAGHLIVDGGMLSNFPIELLVSEAPHVTAIMGSHQSRNVVGLLIDERRQVANAPAAHATAPGFDFGRLKTIRRLKGLIDTMTNAHDKQIIEVLSDLVVRLPAKGYGTTEFDMSNERRDALVEAGKVTMADYLRSRGSLDAKAVDLERLELAQDAATRIASGILGSES